MGNYIRCANFKSRFLIEYNMYINLDSIHARNLKLGMFLPYVQSHKSDGWILKILRFWHFMGEKRQKMDEKRQKCLFLDFLKLIELVKQFRTILQQIIMNLLLKCYLWIPNTWVFDLIRWIQGPKLVKIVIKNARLSPFVTIVYF